MTQKVAKKKEGPKSTWGYVLPNIPLQKDYTTPRQPPHPRQQQQIDYDRFVAEYNKRALIAEKRRDLFPGGARGNSALPHLQNDTHRLLISSPSTEQTQGELLAGTNWQLIKDSVKQNNVWNIVRRFIDKMKEIPVKKKPPSFVNDKLEPTYQRCEYSEGEGWSPWRPDVVFNEFTQFVFNCTAIFLFGARMVLYKVDMDIFPILYLIVIVVGAFYRINTKVLYRRHCIVKRKDILQHYLTWHAVLDGTIIYLCILEYCQVDTSWYRFVIFFKALENKYILSKIEPVADMVKYGKYIYRIFMVYAHIIFIAHCVALLFISSVSKDKVPNWMSVLNLSRDQDHWITVYIRAYYWGFTTLVLDSYGDTTPKRNKEIIMVVLVETIGIAVTAYWLGTLQTIYNEIRVDTLAERKNTRLMNRFLETNNVPYNIQERIKKTVHKLSKSDLIREAQDENTILNGIPPFSKARLLEQVHTKPISTISMFNRFTKSTINKIATFIQRKLFYSMQIVAAQTQIPDRYYMLRNGRICETYLDFNRRVTVVRKIGKINGLNDRLNRLWCKIPKKYLWLALQNTLTQTPCPVSIRSKGQSMVLSIEYTALQGILKEPDRFADYENFCAMRDQVLISGLRIDHETCLRCAGRGHSTLTCNYYHYSPKKELIVMKYIHNRRRLPNNLLQPRFRGKGARRPRFPWVKIQPTNTNTVIGSLSSNQALQKTLEQYRIDKQKNIQLMQIDPNNINSYLTTLPQVDATYEFSSYFSKWNACNVRICKNGRQG